MIRLVALSLTMESRMLRIFGGRKILCNGMSRRDLLHLGGLGMLGARGIHAKHKYAHEESFYRTLRKVLHCLMKQASFFIPQTWQCEVSHRS